MADYQCFLFLSSGKYKKHFNLFYIIAVVMD
nr:MAG TPA: hypothetical protein [Caudoviricetes sp.]